MLTLVVVMRPPLFIAHSREGYALHAFRIVFVRLCVTNDPRPSARLSPLRKPREPEAENNQAWFTRPHLR